MLWAHALRIRGPLFTGSAWSTRSPRATFSLTTSEWQEPSPPSLSNFIRAAKYEQLVDSLTRRRGSPTKAWNYYVDYLRYLGFEKLPLEIHRLVLRKIVPPTNVLRVSTGRNATVASTHMYEIRLQTVIRNIRASEQTPTLEDYHFILEQFAAVGHHAGAWQVLKEMDSLGLQPTSKSYGLCLQALAHRLTLPCTLTARPRLLSSVARLCVGILTQMSEQSIRVDSVNFDLAIRVLKDAGSSKQFEKLLKVGYAIDLDNPDCTPLESSQQTDVPVLLPPMRLPLSTSALNTIVHVLGREGRLSKMVQTFEVLTNPLPLKLSRSYDEDDEDVVHTSPHDGHLHPPSATPNTTTFNMLIMACAQAGNLSLCRHYGLLAVRLNYESDRRLSRDLYELPRAEVLAPTISVNRGTLLPVFGAANRAKDVEMVRWCLRTTTMALKRKRASIDQFTQLTADSTHYDDVPPLTETHAKPSSPCSSGEIRQSREEDGTTYLPDNEGWNHLKKRFDSDLHLSLLKTEFEELTDLETRISDALHRHVTRLKERLGRRVWHGKDIYLSTEQDRVVVSRDRWRDNVRFRPGKIQVLRKPASHGRYGRQLSLTERLRGM